MLFAEKGRLDEIDLISFLVRETQIILLMPMVQFLQNPNILGSAAKTVGFLSLNLRQIRCDFQRLPGSNLADSDINHIVPLRKRNHRKPVSAHGKDGFTPKKPGETFGYGKSHATQHMEKQTVRLKAITAPVSGDQLIKERIIGKIQGDTCQDIQIFIGNGTDAMGLKCFQKM